MFFLNSVQYCAGWILPSATRAWLFVWNVADSASAGIHGEPPVWLVGQVDLVYKRLLSHVLSLVLRSVAVDWVVSDWEYKSVGDETFEYGIKEILHESEINRLVIPDGTDTSSVAPSQYCSGLVQSNLCSSICKRTTQAYESVPRISQSQIPRDQFHRVASSWRL